MHSCNSCVGVPNVWQTCLYKYVFEIIVVFISQLFLIDNLPFPFWPYSWLFGCFEVSTDAKESGVSSFSEQPIPQAHSLSPHMWADSMGSSRGNPDTLLFKKKWRIPVRIDRYKMNGVSFATLSSLTINLSLSKCQSQRNKTDDSPAWAITSTVPQVRRSLSWLPVAPAPGRIRVGPNTVARLFIDIWNKNQVNDSDERSSFSGSADRLDLFWTGFPPTMERNPMNRLTMNIIPYCVPRVDW